MPQPSRLERFLKSFPEEERKVLREEILRCNDSKAAHFYLESKYKYKGSYDSVKSWRKSNSLASVDGLATHAANVARIAASEPSATDPTQMVMNLAQELGSLCLSLTALLQEHQWIEPGEVRLSNREASKLVSVLPGLSRAASGTILEMHRIKSEMEHKTFALAILEEFALDWHRTLESEAPEIVPLFDKVAEITKARLDLDRSSFLESQTGN